MPKVLVTGVAGFVGSHLCDSYLQAGHEVIGIDNMSSGFEENLRNAQKQSSFSFFNVDITEPSSLEKIFSGVDIVVHMAANADIRGGLHKPGHDLQQNTIATHNVLEAMRINEVKRIIFASSAAALGEPTEFPTPENCATPLQTSLYGASKMACEGLISAYCEGFGMEGYIFRFVSLLGPRYPHGHVIDFVKQLRKNPESLVVLGDGTQKKSYLHVEDCVEAIRLVEQKRTATSAKHNVQIYNLGSDDFITVKQSVSFICDSLNLTPKIQYGRGNKGWVGDNPFVFLDTSKIASEGWGAKHDIESAIRATVEWLDKNSPLV